MHDWQDDRIYQRACCGLARLGHDVHLIALNDTEDESSDFISRNVHVKLLPKRSGIKRRWFGSKDIVTEAIKIDADIFHFHDPDLLPHVNRIKKKCPNASVIYDIHENYAGRFSQWGLPFFFGSWFRMYEKQIINQLDGITVVSDSMRKLFEGVKVPIEITRNSTDIFRLQNIHLQGRDMNSRPIVITSGSHSHSRNCLQTVKAIAFTKGQNNETPIFQFVGKYMQGIEEEMKSQSKIDNTSNRLQLDGMQPWEENFKRIALAFCGCVFYADNPNNKVGIPNRLFEYMYCGIPVVVSDFPELRRIVEEAHCGVIVNSESPEDIARGINLLLMNKENAKEMGKNGRVAMENHYGYHIDLEKLVSFYFSILQGSFQLD